MNSQPVRLPLLVNALSVDVEDYFQVSAFESCIARADWGRWPVRVEANTDRVLALLDRHAVRATFFVLGWVAERFPGLLRRISTAGHEVASHGYGHERLTMLSRVAFRESITRSKKLLEDITGLQVLGYRAPSYTVGPKTLWAYPELRAAGYRYSSSVAPIHHDLYGMPKAPRFAFFPDPQGPLEIPVTTVRALNRNWPCGGGGYFRLMPYVVFKQGWRWVNGREHRACVFYFHPWEIDPEQPRVPGVIFKNRVRHYLNLTRTAGRLDRLLEDFRFDRIDHVFTVEGSAVYPVVSLQAVEASAS